MAKSESYDIFMIVGQRKEAYPGEFAEHRLVTDMEEMIAVIRAVKSGSCMGGDKFGAANHPMRVYDPALGWSLAVRYEGQTPVGRCLVFDFNGSKHWVRSYTAGGDDHALERWLNDQGITKTSGWGGDARGGQGLPRRGEQPLGGPWR